MPIIQIQVFC